MNEYLQRHGFYLLGGAAAQVISWGSLAIGTQHSSDALIGFGGLLFLASGIVLVRHAWRAMLMGGLLLTAGLTLGGFALHTFASLLHPLTSGALLLTICIGLFALAGRWWEENGIQTMDFFQRIRREITAVMSSVRNRLGERPTATHGAMRETFQATFTPTRSRIRFQRPPQQDRLCHSCGRLIRSTQQSCPHIDCEQYGERP